MCIILGRGSFVGSKVHEQVTDEGSKKNYKRDYWKQEIKSQSIPSLWNCEDLMVGTCKFEDGSKYWKKPNQAE